MLIIAYQYISFKGRNNDLKYVIDKLNNILDKGTAEKLMVFTEDKGIIELLMLVNRFLENNQKILVDYRKMEITMRRMLSNISHDLKTPLTVVLGYIETISLDRDISSEERQKLLQKVQDKTYEVLALINKFFDLAKLEAGDREIPLTKINTNEICRKSMLSFYDILTSKGLEVSIDIPEVDVFIMANEEALNRILNNLISNSIKYGNEGKIIGLSIGFDDKFVYINIWDKGPGIAEIHRDRVFERMYTLDDSRSKFNEGSGLGLTITKRLVEKLSGEIYLSSKPYEKTIFTCKFKRLFY
jgi:signal transduction histidine kinase